MQLTSLRTELSYPRTSVQLCALGILGGIAAAAVIIVFRLAFEHLQSYIFGGIAGYAQASAMTRLCAPIAAVLAILLVIRLTGFTRYRLGIPYVIHRVKMCYGHIPLVCSINQFFGGIFALASGFVVGKEGPTVHLAAATSHHVGQHLRLPFNALRILTGCGIAAGVAAAFNTPFAAVIFVMEVVLREYKVYLFVPILLSAASGTVMTQLVFGGGSELAFLSFHHIPVSTLPYLLLFGVALGVLAAIFNRQLIFILKLCTNVHVSIRLLLAASITGAVGFAYPQAMGAEFVAIETLFMQEPSVAIIASLLLFKFALTIVAIGLGVPGGIIGAVMTIGMLAGVLLLQPLKALSPDIELTSTFALLGLAGMLAAVLSAPMAALSAVMELSADSAVVMPAIITIVSAYVTSKQMCKNHSIFIQQLDLQQLRYTTSSIRDVLQRTGVMAVMRKEFTQLNNASDTEIYNVLQAQPDQLVLQCADTGTAQEYLWASLDVSLEENKRPLQMQQMQGVIEQSTMAEVYEILHKTRSGAVYVWDQQAQVVLGIITWNMLHAHLFTEQY